MKKKIKSPEELENYRKEIQAQKDLKKPAVAVCAGSGCQALGSKKIIAAFKDQLSSQGLAEKVNISEIKETGCPGFCEKGPIVVLQPDDICYLGVKPEDVPEISEKTLTNGEIIDRLVYTDPVNKEKIIKDGEIPFYKKQERFLLGNNINIDSRRIQDYVAVGGYSALARAFSMKPDEIVQEVIDANLRGRGGGGFPAGWKWHSDRKSVV